MKDWVASVIVNWHRPDTPMCVPSIQAWAKEDGVESSFKQVLQHPCPAIACWLVCCRPLVMGENIWHALQMAKKGENHRGFVRMGTSATQAAELGRQLEVCKTPQHALQ